jgi:hypothetical protein
MLLACDGHEWHLLVMVRTIRGLVCVCFALFYAGCFGQSVPDTAPEAGSSGGAATVHPAAGQTGTGGRRSPPRRATDDSASSGQPSSPRPTAGGTGGQAGESPDASAGDTGGRDDSGGDGGRPSDSDEGICGDSGFEPGHAAGAPANGGTGGTTDSPTEAEFGVELRARWNPIAQSRPLNVYEFSWNQFFPHPTFKMGTAEGYHEFAFVLLGFFEAGDNFDLLVAHRLTRTPLDCSLGMFVTFDELAEQFSTMTFGNIPPDVQSRLKSFSERMP